MATNSEPYIPTLRLKGNTIRAKPSYGHTHLRDCNWIDQVGYTVPNVKAYKGAYDSMTNAGYWFQPMVCNFDLDEWIQHIANIFVREGAHTHQQTGMTKKINQIVRNATHGAETLAEMARFGVCNPDVEYVMHNTTGNKQGWAYYGNLPDEIDPYNGTNYVEFRRWLAEIGGSTRFSNMVYEQKGLAKVRSLPSMIHTAGEILKDMVKGERTDCHVIRNILINNAVVGFAGISLNHPNEIIPQTFLEVCREAWRHIGGRGSWFDWNEIHLQDKPADFNPLTDEQQQTMRKAIQDRAEYMLRVHNKWIAALA